MCTFGCQLSMQNFIQKRLEQPSVSTVRSWNQFVIRMRYEGDCMFKQFASNNFKVFILIEENQIFKKKEDMRRNNIETFNVD